MGKHKNECKAETEEQLDPVMIKWQMVVNRIGQYLKSVSKELLVVNVEGGYMGNWARTIQTVKDRNLTEDIEPIIVCVSAEANIELISWVKYDVEFRIDTRPSGKVGTTGKPEDVTKVMSLLGYNVN